MPGIRPRNVPSARKPEVFSEDLLKRIDEVRRTANEPLRGITTSNGPISGLFPLQPTGLSTRPIVNAALAYLGSLSDAQRAEATFPMQDATWRQWFNGAVYTTRHGLCLEDMTDHQRELGLAIIRESLSGKGYAMARDVMRLNQFLGVLSGLEIDFDEWLYWLSIYGDPSVEGAWGWQIDGHHFNLSCSIIGDQMVMTPNFVGAEPKWADFGPYAGIHMFRYEEDDALRFMQGLNADQRSAAVIATEMPDDLFTGAMRDNFELNYEGIPYEGLDEEQQGQLIDLISIYTTRLRPGHSRIWIDQIREHAEQLHFGWIGGTGNDDVFYYRIHSPVILIEFEHVSGVVFNNKNPLKLHIHTIVRTPNGNDYGRDLLRQHHLQHEH